MTSRSLSTSGPSGAGRAAWCTPCSKSSLPSRTSCASSSLNVDENPETAAAYRITSIPALNVYSGGEVVKQIIGAKPKAILRRELADYLG